MMFRASSLLKNARLEKELDLQDISKKLKINIKYLDAIEQDIIPSFPQEPYCSLIVKDYADFLGLNGNEILRIFRRDFAQKRKTKAESRKNIGFTPQFTFTVSIIITILVFSGYLLSEYIKFNQPPKLKVNWPSESILTTSTVDVNGVTDPESTIRINQDLVIVDPKGNFSKKINLSDGDTRIIIESKSPSGKISTAEKTIRLTK